MQKLCHFQMGMELFIRDYYNKSQGDDTMQTQSSVNVHLDGRIYI